MHIEVTFSSFVDRFHLFERYDQFGYDGLLALFEYLEDFEESCDVKIKLDVIALCCEFTVYENLEEFHEFFNSIDYPDKESIQDSTTFIDIDGTAFIAGEF